MTNIIYFEQERGGENAREAEIWREIEKEEREKDTNEYFIWFNLF